MSSSGLIYAVIVGAWAAYLVPMWLRRQDELNEARPTERFSTAIRLLSGKAGMERRYAKDVERRRAQRTDDAEQSPEEGEFEVPEEHPEPRTDADVPTDPSVDVRSFADPRTLIGVPDEADERAEAEAAARLDAAAEAEHTARSAPRPRPTKRSSRAKRAKLLARRRRTTMCLFLAFTCGAIVAAVGGMAFLWVPAVPAVLLSTYIVYLRIQERRRFTFTMDRRQAEAAASQLHRTRAPRAKRSAPAGDDEGDGPTGPPAGGQESGRYRHHGHATDEPTASVEEPPATPPQRRPAGRPPAAPEADGSADRRALVEQTDHAEWVDQQRAARNREPADGWDPIPVPLPTYVNAPVAPRLSRDVDLEAPDAWSSARTAHPDRTEETPTSGPSRDRRTPLFDQYEGGEERPRAANE